MQSVVVSHLNYCSLFANVNRSANVALESRAEISTSTQQISPSVEPQKIQLLNALLASFLHFITVIFVQR